jgi:hypothetical protein
MFKHNMRTLFSCLLAPGTRQSESLQASMMQEMMQTKHALTAAASKEIHQPLKASLWHMLLLLLLLLQAMEDPNAAAAHLKAAQQLLAQPGTSPAALEARQQQLQQVAEQLAQALTISP